MISSTYINYSNATFLKSAAKLSQCPTEIDCEIAFAGRSNAGKSSALNALTKNAKLARTSKTPGRTQLINYFQLVGTPFALVDLPGYGFAKVPKAVKEEWQNELDNYLTKREVLAGLVLLMDIRHPLKDFDTAMLNWAHQADMPVHVLLTKSDKLKRGPAQAELLKVRKIVKAFNNEVSVQTFSSQTGEGLTELEQVLTRWFKSSKTEKSVNEE